jgi:hypothetical protein
LALHVTNGPSVVGSLAASGLVEDGADILSWEEILYEGPVPETASGRHLREIRVDALSELWGEQNRMEIRRRLAARDEAVAARAPSERVFFWFDADLLDQLQLLDLCAQLDRVSAPDVRLICLTDPVDGRTGFGQLAPDQFEPLLELQEPLTRDRLSLARRAWAAFRSPVPTNVQTLLGELDDRMPVLAEAFRRYLAEFPWTSDGLSRSERLTLRAIASGTTRAIHVYREHLESGESFSEHLPLEAFQAQLSRLASGNTPLVARNDAGAVIRYGMPANHQQLVLTDAGTGVLSGDRDAVAVHGINRWLGGVHLTPTGPVWRFDPEAKRLRAPG